MLEQEAEKKGINLETLKEEQKKLASQVSTKDSFDFSQATRFGAIITEIMGKDIIAVCVILNENLEVLEEKFSIQKLRFPYIPGFRAFRELPVMLDVYEKLEEPCDVFFILGHGIAHPHGLGIASHFGITIEKPTIGVAKHLVYGIEKGNKVYEKKGRKIIAEKLQTRQGSKPIYVSPGHLISLKTAVELIKKCLREPHKLPEPIVAARKFAHKVKEELK